MPSSTIKNLVGSDIVDVDFEEEDKIYLVLNRFFDGKRYEQYLILNASEFEITEAEEIDFK